MVLKHAPLSSEALGTRDEYLHLHLQSDTLPPEKFASVLLGIPWSLPILVVLMVIPLLVLITHKGTFLPFVHSPSASSTKEDRISPSCVSSGLYASFPLLFRLYDDR